MRTLPHALPVADFFPKKLEQRIADHNTAVEKLATDHQQLDKAVADYNAADPLDNADPSGTPWMTMELRGQRYALAVQELKIRRELQTTLAEISTARQAGLAAAHDAHAEALAEAKRRLLAIGFLEPIAGEARPGAYQPGFVLAHPLVRAADNCRRELQDKIAELAAAANESAIDKLQAAIAKERAAA